MTTITECRACGWAPLEPVLSLGNMPLANSLLDHVDDEEACYPLNLVRCPRCDLVQITETVPPEILFREYSYFSSYSDTFVEHARTFATRMQEHVDLGSESLVVEAASNDGYLLPCSESTRRVTSLRLLRREESKRSPSSSMPSSRALSS